MKAQEWLDKNYPQGEFINWNGRIVKIRSEVEEIYLNEPSLEGELDLSDFTYYNFFLERGFKVSISLAVDESKLVFKNQGKNIEIIKLINAQDWLDKEYLPEKRQDIKELNIRNKNLEGSLDCSDFINLTELFCSDNYLTSLKLGNLVQLKILSCSNNNLTNLNFLNNLNPKRLTYLDVSNNNFSEQDCSIFSKFINLNWLKIGNDNQIKIHQGIYNHFTGSLAPLKNLTELESLDIDNTDLNSGWEYLPVSLKYFFYKTNLRPNCKLAEFIKQFQEWEKIGLTLKSPNNFRFIEYLKLKNYTPNPSLNLPKLREEYKKELKKHKKVSELGSSTDYPTLLQRWKEANGRLIEKNKNSFSVIQAQLQAKEQQIKKLKTEIAEAKNDKILVEKLQNELAQKEQEIKDLKSKYDELLNKELVKSLEEKEQELEKLKGKFSKHKYLVEDLLEAEEHLASYDISSDQNQHRVVKEKNISRLKNEGYKQEKINELCQSQNEITQLKLKLEDLKPKTKLTIEGSKTTKLLLDYPIFTQELGIKVNDYLKSKRNFLDARQKTIEELQECVNKLEKKFNKQDIIGEIGNTTSNVGGSIVDVITFGIPQAIGETIKSISNFSKIKIAKKSNEDFQLSLTDEKELLELNDTFKSLNELIKSNQELVNKLPISDIPKDKLFANKYKVYDIIIKDGVWKGRQLTLEMMVATIKSLHDNLDNLKEEVVEQEKQFKKGLEQQQAQIQIPPKE